MAVFKIEMSRIPFFYGEKNQCNAAGKRRFLEVHGAEEFCGPANFELGVELSMGRKNIVIPKETTVSGSPWG